jgi:peroxiredoxin
MKSKYYLTVLCAVLITLMTWGAPIHEVLAGEPAIKKASTYQPEPLAPNFTLKDLKGNSRSLKDFRGKVVLLNFTTTWCPYCKKDIPNLKKLYTTMKGKNFELISIYVAESPKRVAAFVQKNSLPYTILVDPEAAVARTYGVRGVPMKVVVAKSGIVGCWECVSAEKKIDELLKAK